MPPFFHCQEKRTGETPSVKSPYKTKRALTEVRALYLAEREGFAFPAGKAGRGSGCAYAHPFTTAPIESITISTNKKRTHLAMDPFFIGWGRWIRTTGWQIQNLQPYRLAIPQCLDDKSYYTTISRKVKHYFPFFCTFSFLFFSSCALLPSSL